jgi:RimJ/RimL family protein N-acetyltransferase
MTQHLDPYGQPIGFPLPDWSPPPLPPRKTLTGQYCRVEPLDGASHAAGFHDANTLESDLRSWTYLTYGPFTTAEDCRRWADACAQRKDYLFHAIIDDSSGQTGGVAAYMRMDPANGSIEVGGIKYTPLIAQQPVATEAMYLMMKNAFELGYRRYEWKCDALNTPSREAAQRLGFSFEGVFRQAVVYKGRNRDTAWYSITDNEWPALELAFTEWLAPENFDAEGQQIVRLSGLTAPLLRVHDWTT